MSSKLKITYGLGSCGDIFLWKLFVWLWRKKIHYEKVFFNSIRNFHKPTNTFILKTSPPLPKVTVFDLTNRDKINLPWEENHLHSEERLYTPHFHSDEVGLRKRQLYPDSLYLLLQPVMEVLLDTRRQRKLLILYLLIGNVAGQ